MSRPLRWIVIGVPILSILILAVVVLPRRQAAHIPLGPKITMLDRFNAENEARRTAVQLVGGLAVLAGLFLTLRRLDHAERQLALAQQGHLTERYSRAIEQLGNENLHIRLGGIYALERVSLDSPADYVSVMDILSTFVRQVAKWDDSHGTRPAPEELPFDVQAAIRVFSRRPLSASWSNLPWLDLRRTDLRMLEVDQANLRRLVLTGAHLERTTFWFGALSGSSFFNAHLEGATLHQVELRRCFLGNAHCDGANFHHCDLEDAILAQASLVGCRFSGANLRRAVFTGADLTGADFYGAKFADTIICGANLSNATNLSLRQLEGAIRDEGTTLPPGFPKADGSLT